MILGFKQQFLAKIITGKKIHTVRRDRSGRWKRFATIHFATGVRTPNYQQFKTAICTCVMKCRIWPHRGVVELKMIHEGMCMYREVDADKFAVNDGFENKEQFFQFFIDHYKLCDGNESTEHAFYGSVIFWSENPYV